VRKFLELFFEKRKQTKKEVLLLIIIFAYLIISRVFKELDTLWFSIVVGITLCILGIFTYLDRKRNRKSYPN
jgi:D-alanyl-lipoteichoic acid acyltransferase DltB (MBOAT superfamily)